MSTTAQWVFETAMHLMDRTANGVADYAHTQEYKSRCVAILNVLCGECFTASDNYAHTENGKRPLCPVLGGMGEELGLDDGLCRTVLPYGLAAHLLLEEDPASASFFQQRYEELLGRARRSAPTSSHDITDCYGGVTWQGY